MKKILFGITSLNIGGAERVLIDLVNELSKKDYDITIFTIYGNGILEKQLSKKIKLLSMCNKRYEELSKLEKIKNSLKILFFYKIKSNYDIVISFLEGPITRLFSRIKNTKKMAWVHVDISKIFGKGLKAKIKQLLDKKIYKKYAKIVFVSEDNKKVFEKIYGFKEKLLIINNFLNYNTIIEKSEENFNNPFDKNYYNIVSMSRLTEQKSVIRFLRIFNKLKLDKTRVYYIGDGPEAQKIRNEIEKLKEKNFILMGIKENPYPYLKYSDAFCLLSLYEGYGMVIDEAKILNKKIMITKTAAVEALKDYSNSIIVDNSEDGIENGLKKLQDTDLEVENYDCKKYYEEILIKIEKLINGE